MIIIKKIVSLAKFEKFFYLDFGDKILYTSGFTIIT